MTATGREGSRPADPPAAPDPAVSPPAGAEAPPVYFLLHLPKTAGQTITAHLRAHAPAGSYLEPRRGRAPDPRLDAATAPALRALSGHWLARADERWFGGREIRRSVLLRDPVGVQVSLYNFRMMSYLAKGLGGYSFDLHLKAMPRNYLAQCLLTRWLGLSRLAAARLPDAAQLALVEAALARFWFVGSYRDCDRLIASIAPDLAVPPVAGIRNDEREWREQVCWQPLTAAALPPATRARILADQAVDQQLWERWSGVGFGPPPPTPPAPPAASARSHPARIVATAAHEALRLFRRDWSRPARIGQARRVASADRARGAAAWPLAATRYAHAIARGGDTPALWLQYARALALSGRRGQAITAYRRALALKPDMPTASRELAACLADGED